MKEWPKEMVQPMTFTFMGVLFGVIGNFMVTSYYRVADKLNYNSLYYDLITFILSLIIVFWFSYYFIIKIQKKEIKESNKEKNQN